MMIEKKSLVKGLALVLVLFSVVACSGGADQQSKYLERAEKHFASENYEKAKVDARNVLQINPKNLAARVILADIDFQDGNIRKAFGGYSATVEEQSDNVAARIGLAKIHVAVKGFDKAVEHADIALAAEPNNADAMGFKALALMGLEKSEDAYALATDTLAVDAGNTASLGVVTQYLSVAGKYQEALDALEVGQAANPEEARISIMKLGVYQEMKNQDGMEKELLGLTKRFPESEQYSTMLAGFYVRDSRPELAEQAVRRYAEENDESFEAKRRLVVYLLQQESQEKAIAQAKAYIDKSPGDTKLINTLAEVYLFTGDRQRGIETLYESIDVDSESVGAIEARSRLVQLYLEEEDVEKARSLIADTLDVEPENEIALMGRVAINLSEGNLKDGITDLRLVTKNNPENLDAVRILAQAQEAVGSRDLALDNYKKLISLGDRTPQTLANAARLAIQAKQYQEAEKYIRASLEQQEQSDDPGLVTNLVRLLALKEDWTEAYAFAGRLVESENSKALGLYLKGAIDLQTDNQQSAIENFKASLKEQPQAIETLAAYSAELGKVEGQEAAIDFVEKHCESHRFANCQYVLGTLYAQNEDYPAAIEALESSLALDDKSVRVYRQLARIHAVNRDGVSYKNTLERAIDATGNRSMKFDLATYHYGDKNYQEAADIYEGIIAQASGQALAAKNNLAMIYVDYLATDDNMKKARAFVADLQESENPAYLDTVGWVSYKSGDYDQAVTYTKAAVDKLGDAPILRYHLGMAYYKAGDLALAKEHLEVATQNKDARYDGFEEALKVIESI